MYVNVYIFTNMGPNIGVLYVFSSQENPKSVFRLLITDEKEFSSIIRKKYLTVKESKKWTFVSALKLQNQSYILDILYILELIYTFTHESWDTV